MGLDPVGQTVHGIAGPVRVGIEAAVRASWDRWLLGERGAEKKAGFVGMEGFGASGPYKELAKLYGFTAENVTAIAREMLAAGN